MARFPLMSCQAVTMVFATPLICTAKMTRTSRWTMKGWQTRMPLNQRILEYYFYKTVKSSQTTPLPNQFLLLCTCKLRHTIFFVLRIKVYQLRQVSLLNPLQSLTSGQTNNDWNTRSNPSHSNLQEDGVPYKPNFLWSTRLGTLEMRELRLLERGRTDNLREMWDASCCTLPRGSKGRI